MLFVTDKTPLFQYNTERVFQQTIGITMTTNSAPLLADLFLHAYEEDFLQGIIKNKEKN